MKAERPNMPRRAHGGAELPARSAVDSTAWFFLARFLSVTGDQFVTFTIPVAVYLLSGKATYAGAAFFLEWLPRSVALPLLGMVVDRFRVTTQIKYIDVARALLMVLACLANNIFALMLAAGISSVFNAYAFLLADKLIYTELPPPLPANQAKLLTLVQMAKIVSPAGSGLLISLAGVKVTLLVSMGLFGVSFLANSLNFAAAPAGHAALPQNSTSAEGPLRSLIQTARLLLQLKPLHHIQLVTFCVNLTEGVCGALLPVFVLGYFKQSSRTLGYVNCACAAASVLLLVALGRRLKRFQLRQLGVLSAALMFVAGFVVAFGRAFLLFTAALTIFTAARNALGMYLRTERLLIIPRERAGRALGLAVSCDLAAFPLAGAIVTLLGAKVSPFHIMFAITTFSFISTSFAIRPLMTLTQSEDS